MEDLYTTTSDFTVEQVIDRMISTIEDQGWHLFARIDHAKEARRIGLELRPTELILFGNPKIGTLLMQDRQISAIDLPMKALAWEDEDGETQVAYNNVKWIKKRHALTDEKTIKNIDAVIHLLMKQAGM